MENNKSISPYIIIMMGVVAMMWSILFTILIFFFGFWAFFIDKYYVPKRDEDTDCTLTWEPEEMIAKKRGVSVEQIKKEINEFWKIDKEKGEEEAQIKLWDIKEVSKWKQFYCKHIHHIGIVLGIMAFIFFLLAIIFEYHGW